jgi:MoxR-like ATPase
MNLGAKARSIIEGRVNPGFQDVKAVCPLVLRHRLITNFNAEADGVSTSEIIADIVERTPVPK